MSTSTGRAIVVGSSVAGLAAACALASRADEVVVLERNRLPATADPATSIAPQGGFPHVLLAAGATTLNRLAPGLNRSLFEHGASGGLRTDFPGYWWAEGAVRRTFPYLGHEIPLCSRALVETRLRAHVRTLRNVRLVDAATVEGVTIRDHRVRGVTAVIDGERSVLDADLVVDASGRASHATTWLTAAGLPKPPVSRVDVGVTYTAIDVRRRPEDLDGGLFAVVQNSAALARVGVALPAEGDRWKIVLGGYFGDAAGEERAAILAFAASLPDPVIRRLLDNEWLTGPARYRFAFSQRRHWERLRDLPAGLCVVGDAVASFNPLYGQGMSAAALQVEALADCLDRFGNDDRLPHRVARRTAKVVDNPWRIATGADFIYPQTVGRRPAGTDRVNRYLARLTRVAATDRSVNVALMRVQHLLAPATSLFAPSVVGRVLGRRAPGDAGAAPEPAARPAGGAM